VRDSASKKLLAAGFWLLDTPKSKSFSVRSPMKIVDLRCWLAQIGECLHNLLYRGRIFAARRKIVWRSF
jgi:hypothetical protein